MRHEYGKLLSSHTSLKIGGPAFCWIQPENLDEIIEAVEWAERNKRHLSVIGKGTNLLANDKGFDGVLINPGSGFDFVIRESEEIVRVGPAVSVSRVITKCLEWDLGGCEFLSGIPGSFGGAVFMNAGVRSAEEAEQLKQVKDILLDVDIYDLKDKEKKNLVCKDIPFAYRSSGLNGKCILGARIKLKKDEKSAINGRIAYFSERRRWMQGLGYPSAGCIFKNPDNSDPAGKLIDSCGLKGRRVGGAEVSSAHANFIVNTGGATAKDVMDLIELIRDTVRQRFGIDLELEIRII